MNAHTPILTPLAVQNADVLRELMSGKHTTVAGLARVFDRDPDNFRKTLKALEAGGLVATNPEGGPVPALSEIGVEALAAIERAENRSVAPPAASLADSGFAQLILQQIEPDPLNPRKEFDPEAIAELADSIARDGLLENLVVRPGRLEGLLTAPLHRLVAGERRWRAIKLLIERGAWPKDRPIMCKVVDIDDAAHRRIALVENLQRKDLRPIDEARALKELMDLEQIGTAEIAKEIGFTQRFVQQRIQLLELDDASQDAVNDGRMSIEDARRRAAAPKPEPLQLPELLVLAEVIVKATTDPRKGTYSGETEVAHTADKDPILTALRKANILSLDPRDWKTKRAYVRRGYNGHSYVASQLAPLVGKDAEAADALLDRLRTEVAGPEAAKACSNEDRYHTPWLNGPFELSAAAKADLERDRAANAQQREANKMLKEKRAKALQRFVDLDARLRAAPPLPVDPEIPGLIAKFKIALPVQLKGGRIFDAKGNAVADCNWRFAEDGEVVNMLLATLSNAAAGYGIAGDDDLPDSVKALATGAAKPIASDDGDEE